MTEIVLGSKKKKKKIPNRDGHLTWQMIPLNLIFYFLYTCIICLQVTVTKMSDMIICILIMNFLSVVLDSVWERSESKKRDFWEDRWPADHPVCFCSQRWAYVLGSFERRRLRMERNHSNQDCAGCTRGTNTHNVEGRSTDYKEKVWK